MTTQREKDIATAMDLSWPVNGTSFADGCEHVRKTEVEPLKAERDEFRGLYEQLQKNCLQMADSRAVQEKRAEAAEAKLAELVRARAEEREAAAQICERLAEMREQGAGESLRQAARMIREGDDG